MNIIEKYDKSFVYAGVIFNLLIGWQFYQLWSNPQDDQAGYIITMATLMGFEFIMVHSGVFMAIFPKKWSLFIFFPFYGLFALGFASTVEDGYIILITYLVAVFNRMRFAFADVARQIKTRSIITSIFAAIIYFFLVFAVAMGADFVPKWGLTQEYLVQSGFMDAKETGGILIDMPQTAMCLGMCYYTLLAFFEWWVSKRSFSNFDGLFVRSNNHLRSTFVRGKKKEAL